MMRLLRAMREMRVTPWRAQLLRCGAGGRLAACPESLLQTNKAAQPGNPARPFLSWFTESLVPRCLCSCRVASCQCQCSYAPPPGPPGAPSSFALLYSPLRGRPPPLRCSAHPSGGALLLRAALLRGGALLLRAALLIFDSKPSVSHEVDPPSVSHQVPSACQVDSLTASFCGWRMQRQVLRPWLWQRIP
jgi:hypothetical protein